MPLRLLLPISILSLAAGGQCVCRTRRSIRNYSPGEIASFRPRTSRPLASAASARKSLTGSRPSRVYTPGAAAPIATQLSHPEKDALIGALTARLVLADQRIAVQAGHIAAQDARIAALEVRLNQLTRPPKTPSNSSKPPSQGQKQDLPASATDRPPRKSRPGVGRTLHPNPDRTIERLLTTGPKCQAVFPDVSQTPQQVYERIELPPVRPDVTQIRLFGGRCACCGERVTAEAPAGLEQGSPFGPSIAAMVVYLHYAQAIGMERLALLMNELFSLSISEGAISNILARAREPLLDATATIEKVVLASPVVCSDETSVRVKGKNWWEWVFIGTLAVLHTIQPSRGKVVVTALFGDIRPEVWVSDMLGSQRGHGVLWQVCLAHLLRDATYAFECGDTAFSAPFRWLLLRAIAIGRRRETLKDTTLKHYLYDLDRRLDRILAAVPLGEPGRKLHKRMLANRAHLLVFMTDRAVPYTNNISERHLRPSVIFRKVTNGFRCEWGAETYAAFGSVVSTAKANRASVLDTVRFVLSAKRSGEALAGAG
jgi:transposase